MGSTGKTAQNNSGISGYNVTASNGQKLTFYFEKSSDGTTYYRNTINGVGEPTPDNMTEKQFIERIKNNGGTADKMSDADITKQLADYRKDREEFNAMMNRESVRNRGADLGERAYRNTRRASRIAKRGK